MTNFRFWRGIHIASAGVLALLALVHSCLTFVLYPAWGPDSVWFLGTGLGLLFLAVLNLTHIGIEPCHRPSARLIRWANWPFLAFGIAGAVAISEPQGFVMAGCLAGQAAAALVTLPGPAHREADD